MKNACLKRIEHYCLSILDHLCSRWYRLFLGNVGKGTLIRRYCRLDGDSLDNVSIGDFCDIDTHCIIGCRSRIKNADKSVIPSIKIGNGCVFGQYNHITAVNKIIIGNNLLTGRFVLITDNSHGNFTLENLVCSPSRREVVSKGEIVIGNNVWLGDKVSILPGVHIGDGCVVGANSVVTHNIPSNSMVAGNPAKIIKTVL